MSRIGKQPIFLPEGVEVDVRERVVRVSGKLGTLTMELPEAVAVEREDRRLRVAPRKETKQTPALWGLTRALLANAVRGVSEGFAVRLILEGIGYRAALEGDTLVLTLGFSHPVRVPAPEGIRFSVEKNVITVSGFDKQQVGNVAASIRAFRKPEPYKGKGIRREGEIVRRKAGKKAAALAK
ncbi:MAG: 50S ribosomal protein L6 [Candidatus Terrybacteria bacterium]|nr:50S ribosomal protein L6 [Candidatus Terrybacteria bacterium]